jgi:hypothetical protein
MWILWINVFFSIKMWTHNIKPITLQVELSIHQQLFKCHNWIRFYSMFWDTRSIDNDSSGYYLHIIGKPCLCKKGNINFQHLQSIPMLEWYKIEHLWFTPTLEWYIPMICWYGVLARIWVCKSWLVWTYLVIVPPRYPYCTQ